MQIVRIVLTFTLAAGSAFTFLCAAEPQTGSSTLNTPMVVRVFYLQGIEPRDAMKVARSEVDVRHLVIVPDRNVLIEGDFPDVVDRSERLLRGRDAVTRT